MKVRGEERNANFGDDDENTSTLKGAEGSETQETAEGRVVPTSHTNVVTPPSGPAHVNENTGELGHGNLNLDQSRLAPPAPAPAPAPAPGPMPSLVTPPAEGSVASGGGLMLLLLAGAGLGAYLLSERGKR